MLRFFKFSRYYSDIIIIYIHIMILVCRNLLLNFEIVNAKEVVVAQIKLTRAARAAAQEGK